jgi:GT2 family glycosyltransferase
MHVAVLVLNYNGQALLAECLPSIVAAAGKTRYGCSLHLVDNGSLDGSRDFVRRHYPQVTVHQCRNRGLCSFNEVAARVSADVVVLLNNDIQLAADCFDALLAPLDAQDTNYDGRCFATAPRCYLFDRITYEGFKTSVRWRLGLVQATALFPDCRRAALWPSGTASAGAVLAVRRDVFLRLGGFDDLYLPGRLEDVDFCFRGYQAGYHIRYVPPAVAYHRGMASFGPAFGVAGCDHLALRNTLLFQWKNLRHPLHLFHQALGLPLRLVRDLLRAPLVPREARFAFARGLWAAAARARNIRPTARRPGALQRERAYFKRFHPRSLLHSSSTVACP